MYDRNKTGQLFRYLAFAILMSVINDTMKYFTS